jgi:DNA-binding response OmpR family regulator
MKKILLINDGTGMFEHVRASLEREGYVLAQAEAGGGLIECCRGEKPDLILIDTPPPERTGLEICRHLRQNPELTHVPVIMLLTSRASEMDRIAGLEEGADDYIVKPFSARELIARVRVRLRRRNSPDHILKVGRLELNNARCEVVLEGRPVVLTATEFKLLGFLMARPGAVFSSKQLLEALWGQTRGVTTHNVSVYILRLRKKIEADPCSPSYIRSVRGFGYSISAAEA